MRSVTAETNVRYTGRGEFYTGIRTGDVVTLRVEVDEYQDGQQSRLRKVVSFAISNGGAWLCLYDLKEVEQL